MRELHLFAGAGGGILGGILLGHRCVAAVELEPYCRKVLEQRQRDGVLEPFPIFDDVRTFDGTAWRGRVDVVCGGFPCQDISNAGKKHGLEGEKSSLWWEMHRVVREVDPCYVFVENVAALLVRGFDRVLGSLADLGFDAEWCVLSAASCGAPHLRQRLWLLAANRDRIARGQQQEPRQELEATLHADGNGTAESVADPSSKRQRKGRTRRAPQHGQSRKSSRSPVPDANRDREPAVPVDAKVARAPDAVHHATRSQRQGIERAERVGTKHADAGGAGWWESEPRVGRVADGVPSRMDRLHAIGNAQVPIVAATAFRILKDRLLHLG